MIEQIGKPTTEEKEILNITLEECAEVIQCISKILRFGFDSCHPDTPEYTNRQHLSDEVGDLMAMIGIMFEKEVLNEPDVLAASLRKVDKLTEFSNIKFKGE